MSYLIRQVLAKPRLIIFRRNVPFIRKVDASYVRCVLFFLA